MTPTELSLILGLGVVSSLHCVQMCGPIVISIGMNSTNRGQFAYHAGRLLTYSLLGAVAGAAGTAIELAGKLMGVERIAMVGAGLLMILAGLVMGRFVPKAKLIEVGTTQAFSRMAGRFLVSPSLWSKFAMGLALGFLPCGLIYAALIQAMSTGSPLSGALTMLAFGVGTTGALLALGLCSVSVARWLGRYSNAFAVTGMILLGVVLVWRGVSAGGGHVHPG